MNARGKSYCLVKADQVNFCWTPNSDKVALVPFPDDAGLSVNYQSADLGCNQLFRQLEGEKKQMYLYRLAVEVMTEDKVDAKTVHNCLMHVSEYHEKMPESYLWTLLTIAQGNQELINMWKEKANLTTTL